MREGERGDPHAAQCFSLIAFKLCNEASYPIWNVDGVECEADDDFVRFRCKFIHETIDEFE